MSTHHIANDEFRVALTLRLRLPQKCILPGTMCDCRKGKSAIPLDPFGIHLTTGCIKGGNSIHNHDRMKEQTVKILSYCGLSTKVEEKNAFRGYDEDNGNRPDITIFNLPDHTGKYFLDIRLSSPVPANAGPLTLPQAKKRFRSGNQAFIEKVRYYQHATAQGLGFLPIIFETTGQMHPDTESFFTSCLQQAARVRQIPLPVLWKYWMSSLMFTLQRTMASGIIGRSFEVYGRKHKEHFETSRGAIRDFGYLNSM